MSSNKYEEVTVLIRELADRVEQLGVPKVTISAEGNTDGISSIDAAGSSTFDSSGNTSGSTTPVGTGSIIQPPVPPIILGNVLPVILTDRGTNGASQTRWSMHLGQRWNIPMGDYSGADGVMQGDLPFSKVDITKVGEYTLDVTEIIKSGKPVFLKMSGRNSPSARFAGRGSSTPPRIVATDAGGNPVDVKVLAYAAWSSSSSSAFDTYMAGSVGSTSNGAVSYSADPGVEKATLVLTCLSKGTPVGTLATFACEAQPCRVSDGGLPPSPGITAEVGNSLAALRGHPDVLFAEDFSDTTKFSGYSHGINTPMEYLDDLRYPGEKVARGKFVPSGHGSMNFSVQLSKCDLNDPLRPIKSAPKEIFCSMDIMLEESFLNVWQDAQKAGIGFDQRFGWWNESGYWQNTTGNGGIPGTGLKLLIPPGTYSGQKKQQWEYQGHSQRMEFGMSPQTSDHPYGGVRPVQSYVYDLDQPGSYGHVLAFGRTCIPIGEFVNIEQQLRTNSISDMDEIQAAEGLRGCLFDEYRMERRAAVEDQMIIARQAEFDAAQGDAKKIASLMADIVSKAKAKAEGALMFELSMKSFAELDFECGVVRERRPNMPLLHLIKTVSGNYRDHYGNGWANRDGVVRTWLGGVFAGEHTEMAWRRHEDMGVEGPWIVWYYGGRGYPPHVMYYQQARVVVATRRIGV